MLARSLWLLASILFLVKCVNGLGWYGSFGAHRTLSTDGGSHERHSPTTSWLDHQALGWINSFRSTNWRHRLSRIVLRISAHSVSYQADDLKNSTIYGNARSQYLQNGSREIHEIPQYVFDHAPLVHLYSEEKFWPCDIAEHLLHVTPELNYTPIYPRIADLNLTNLDGLNDWDEGRYVYLTSDDNVEEMPDWLTGLENIPDIPEAMKGYTSPLSDSSSEKKQKTRGQQQQGGRSDAPAFLICVDKGQGVVDAFWFFFYSFNLGNVVFNVRFGNHVGDWEHTLVRFQHGIPKYVFFSEHNFGSAYGYGAVEKIGKRPVIYSAVGTHAMYATPGIHPYILPLGILHDQTDRGPLWDPVLNAQTYTYNHLTDDLRASNVTPHAPTEWFYFAGRWGDKLYPLKDKRQYMFLRQYHYVSGPLGPRFKNLGRKKVCQGRYSDPCVIKNWLAPTEVKYWEGPGDGEEED